MNHKIATIFKGYLQTLSWADKLSGLVQTVSAKTGGGEFKTYPVSCDISEDACLNGAYQDLCPDSKKYSVMYFEDKGCQQIERRGNRLKFRSNLRLVGWINLKLLSRNQCEPSGCGTVGDYVIQVIKVLPTKPIQTADFISIYVSDISEAEHSADIFSKYTYNETATQYLMFPFAFFALDLQIDFVIPCNTEELV